MIEEQTVVERHTLTIRTITTPSGLQGAFGDILGKVMGYLQSHGITPTSPPFGYYHSFSPERVDLEAGFCTASKVEGAGTIQPSHLPGGRVAVAWHMGPYDTLIQTHTAMQAYCKAHGGDAVTSWEVYWTDPGSGIKPEEWKTEVVYPINGGGSV